MLELFLLIPLHNKQLYKVPSQDKHLSSQTKLIQNKYSFKKLIYASNNKNMLIY